MKSGGKWAWWAAGFGTLAGAIWMNGTKKQEVQQLSSRLLAERQTRDSLERDLAASTAELAHERQLRSNAEREHSDLAAVCVAQKAEVDRLKKELAKREAEVTSLKSGARTPPTQPAA